MCARALNAYVTVCAGCFSVCVGCFCVCVCVCTALRLDSARSMLSGQSLQASENVGPKMCDVPVPCRWPIGKVALPIGTGIQ